MAHSPSSASELSTLMGMSDSALELSSSLSASIFTTLGAFFRFRMARAASGSGVVDVLNAELLVSSPFGAFLTFFGTVILILLVAFHLCFPVAWLAFDARDSDDFMLDVVDWLASRLFSSCWMSLTGWLHAFFRHGGRVKWGNIISIT
jgi:hypothetical protein